MMRNDKHLKNLEAIAGYCLDQYRGITTPTGRRKKPPTYFIRECGEHGYVMTSSSYPAAERDVCPTLLYSPEKTRSTSRPYTLVCKKETELVKEMTYDPKSL